MEKFRFYSAIIMGIVAIVLGAIIFFTSPAEAVDNKTLYARQMNCRVTLTTFMSDSPKNTAIRCKVVEKPQSFYIVKYENQRLALDWYTNFFKSKAGDQYFVMKGSYFILPDGGSTTGPYTQRWANYAYNKVGGVVLRR